MKKMVIVVLLLLAAGLLTGCNKQPDRVSAAQPQPESAPAPQPVAARMPVPDAKEVASPVPTADQQRCAALDDKWEELDPSYDPQWKQNEGTDANRKRKIEKRGYTDSATDIEYETLKECHRNSDENLKQEKPALECCGIAVHGMKFGMTEAEIGTTVLSGKWTFNCKRMTSPGTKVASMCDYWSADKFVARAQRSAGLGDKVPYVATWFDSNGGLIMFTQGDWVPVKTYENTSNVVRFWRNEGSLAKLDIPDQQSEISADWYFKSRSTKDKYGMPMILEIVTLSAARQGNSFFVEVTYTDDESYQD